MKELQPFTKEFNRCPKCLSDDVKFRHFNKDEDEPEFIEVTCEACGYSWDMEVANPRKKELILEKESGDHLPEKLVEAKEKDETKLAPVEKE